MAAVIYKKPAGLCSTAPWHSDVQIRPSPPEPRSSYRNNTTQPFWFAFGNSDAFSSPFLQPQSEHFSPEVVSPETGIHLLLSVQRNYAWQHLNTHHKNALGTTGNCSGCRVNRMSNAPNQPAASLPSSEQTKTRLSPADKEPARRQPVCSR